MKQHDRFKYIGQAGKEYAINNFSKEKCVSKLENLLSK